MLEFLQQLQRFLHEDHFSFQQKKCKVNMCRVKISTKNNRTKLNKIKKNSKNLLCNNFALALKQLWTLLLSMFMETIYLRMDWVKLVGSSFWKIWSDMMSLISLPYHFRFFKGYFPQISIGPCLNKLSISTGTLLKITKIFHHNCARCREFRALPLVFQPTSNRGWHYNEKTMT